jgi:hypothetical protein
LVVTALHFFVGKHTSNGNGDIVGFNTFLNVPQGYLSGHLLSSQATWDNQTFSSLGVTPGTYVWTWGTGADQRFTLEAEAPTAAPEPASLTLMGLGLAGLAAYGRRGRKHAAA